MTRDLRKKKIILWDKPCELVDSPGLMQSTSVQLEKKIRENTIDYCRSADLIILVFDGRLDLTVDDFEIISLSRKFNKPILLVMNKTEGKFSQNVLYTLNNSGLGQALPVSATHNQSIDQLKWKIYECIKDLDFQNAEGNELSDFSVAIVGKTNTGKSTIFNLIKKKKIALTGSQPNLTRDSIETDISFKDLNFKMFDTAGFSKNNREKIIKLSTNQTLKKIRLCKVILVVFDINNYFEKINSKIISLVCSENRCNLILVNKIDSVNDLPKKEVIKHIQELNPQIKDAPIMFVSARDNRGFEDLHSTILKQLRLWKKRIKTSELNEWLVKVMIENPPPLNNGRAVKLKYVSQVSTSPPKFNIFSNYPSSLKNHYKRYISNKLKRKFHLEGIPVKISFKKTVNPYEKN